MDLGQDGGREDDVDTTTKYRLLKIKPFFGDGGINWCDSDNKQLMASFDARILFWHHSENQARA